MTTNSQDTAVEPVTVEFSTYGKPIKGIFSYDPADPLVVTLTLFSAHDPDTPIPWIWSRALLAEAIRCRKEIGDGDVHLWRHGNRIVILLLSNDGYGQVGLVCNTQPVVRFLNATRRACPVCPGCTVPAEASPGEPQTADDAYVDALCQECATVHRAVSSEIVPWHHPRKRGLL